MVPITSVKLPRVLETLLLIGEGANRVITLADALDVSRPTVAIYLQTLRDATLIVRGAKVGKAQPYQLTEAGEAMLWSVVQDLHTLMMRVVAVLEVTG